MHITVFCPHCQSRFQLDAALRGKRMRCPNTICQMVFEVREEERPAVPLPDSEKPTPEKPPSARHPVTSGRVGELVHVLPGEAVGSEPVAQYAPDKETRRQQTRDQQANQSKPARAVSLPLSLPDSKPALPVLSPPLDDLDFPGEND